MQSITLVVHHEVGLHARPAALFVQAASAHQSEITVSKDGKSGNAKSILAILALAVQKDNEITITANGPDERPALDALRALVENNFGE